MIFYKIYQEYLWINLLRIASNVLMERMIKMPVKVGLKFIEKWGESMENKILEYEKEPIIKDQIVFYGPSNFTRWAAYRGNTPLREAVLGHSGAQCCINRGFGSSCTEHHLYYYHRMVKALEPRVLVYSPGLGNATAMGYTPEETWELAQRVMAYAKEDFPNLRIYLCGVFAYRDRNKPNYPDLVKFDGWLREYAENTPDCTYIDVTNYEPLHRDDIYDTDGKHFNRLGYDIYAELFREALKDELALY